METRHLDNACRRCSRRRLKDEVVKRSSLNRRSAGTKDGYSQRLSPINPGQRLCPDPRWRYLLCTILEPEKRPLAVYSYCDGIYEQDSRFSTEEPRPVPVLHLPCNRNLVLVFFCYGWAGNDSTMRGRQFWQWNGYAAPSGEKVLCPIPRQDRVKPELCQFRYLLLTIEKKKKNHMQAEYRHLG